MQKSLKQRIIIGLSLVGPGLFLIGYNIGTGSITTMAKAGADYGMTLFWALILSCIFTYILRVYLRIFTSWTSRIHRYNQEYII